MVQKCKVCMLGATGVGKTSLVERFVRSIFSDVYRTTVGVMIEKCRVVRAGRAVDLVVWDLNGEDEFQSVQLSYLRGAAGCLLVADGTRRETVDAALELRGRAVATVGHTPVVLAVNKTDLLAAWELESRDLETLARRGWPVVQTSARTGDGVCKAFGALADAMLAMHQHA
jgi:small GTP-binding protein